jgi:hypothetical protein
MDMRAHLTCQTGRRRDSRLRLRRGVPATLMTLDGQISASIIDLSSSGAHVRAAFAFRTGQQMMVWWLGFETFGTVVWVRGADAGIEFDEPLPPAAVLHTRREVDQGQVQTPEQLARQRARDWFDGHR